MVRSLFEPRFKVVDIRITKVGTFPRVRVPLPSKHKGCPSKGRRLDVLLLARPSRCAVPVPALSQAALSCLRVPLPLCGELGKYF
jgi:hypothetical protein